MPPSEEVRIFLEFSRMEEAMKAVIGLHNRFFNQRNLVAAFYDIGLYEKGELTAPTNGWINILPCEDNRQIDYLTEKLSFRMSF